MAKNMAFVYTFIGALSNLREFKECDVSQEGHTYLYIILPS